MRYTIFFVLVLILLSALINYKNFSSADEVWTIKKYKKLAYARVSGEVQHGDALNFFILAEDNCNKIWNTFTSIIAFMKLYGRTIKEGLKKGIQCRNS